MGGTQMRVEIRLTGLCAFVKNTNGATIRVVLVDSSGDPPPCDQHLPALIVPVSYWDQAINQLILIVTFFLSRE